jgi:hypothetical protein
MDGLSLEAAVGGTAECVGAFGVGATGGSFAAGAGGAAVVGVGLAETGTAGAGGGTGAEAGSGFAAGDPEAGVALAGPVRR